VALSENRLDATRLAQALGDVELATAILQHILARLPGEGESRADAVESP
jgi:hypothetical protein